MGAAAVVACYGMDRQHLAFAIEAMKRLKRRMQTIEATQIKEAALLSRFRKNKVPAMCSEIGISVWGDSRQAIECATKDNDHKAWIIRTAR
ncbi:hypothetical protein AA0229_1993 [Gluconobacter cerinus NRIC 0229]|nr:hypothetical protein AA0229_1993 [Gluconobacter cerinus NRIC 0229]